MAPNFKLFSLIWLVAAFPTPQATTAADGTPVPPPQATTEANGTLVPTSQETTAGPGGSSATPQVTPDRPSTKPPLTPAPTKPLPGPCESNPCGDGSTCVPRFNQMFECLCLPGRVYNKDSSTCESAKVFPGQLTLTNKYNSNHADPTSEDFLNVSKGVVTELDDVFKSTTGYSKSIVLKLKSTSSVRVWFRATSGILAEVENIFEPAAVIDTKTITETLKKAIKDSSKDSILNGAAFKACPSGQKAGPSGCVACTFGYSGLNCNESWQLALVVVSVVVGLLLISAIVMVVLARRYVFHLLIKQFVITFSSLSCFCHILSSSCKSLTF
ncbi:mucin-13-like isoform X3 [Labrus mixtus]|uniref:mucin-13-like isoform X3 n=1 Tax=Labrus mixtus TaxID=508554 RepID=UPI0029C0ED53|nr:mucin-13-like isoform X3 [Labrus mixtus]